jgi:hypothetical protein
VLAADLDAIRRFLELLQHTSQGRALTVNILDSHTEGLHSASTLQGFLLECVRTYEAGTISEGDVFSIVEAVSLGYGVGQRSYLRQFKQRPFFPTDKQRLSSTMKTESFSRFLVDPRYKDGGSGLPVVLPPVPGRSPSGMLDYEKRLADVTSNPAWYAPTATIGRPLPYPSNCWITTDFFGPDPDAPPYEGNPATKARDELGLVDYGAGSCLLTLSFSASSLATLIPCELARPTFSDLGNSRFRVSPSSDRAAEYAELGWGAAVHLGKFRARPFVDATGASERVSTSLPVSALKSLTVKYLGRVEQDRGTTAQLDDDDVFAEVLEAGRTAKDIRDMLILRIASVA